MGEAPPLKRGFRGSLEGDDDVLKETVTNLEQLAARVKAPENMFSLVKLEFSLTTKCYENLLEGFTRFMISTVEELNQKSALLELVITFMNRAKGWLDLINSWLKKGTKFASLTFRCERYTTALVESFSKFGRMSSWKGTLRRTSKPIELPSLQLDFVDLALAEDELGSFAILMMMLEVKFPVKSFRVTRDFQSMKSDLEDLRKALISCSHEYTAELHHVSSGTHTEIDETNVDWILKLVHVFVSAYRITLKGFPTERLQDVISFFAKSCNGSSLRTLTVGSQDSQKKELYLPALLALNHMKWQIQEYLHPKADGLIDIVMLNEEKQAQIRVATLGGSLDEQIIFLKKFSCRKLYIKNPEMKLDYLLIIQALQEVKVLRVQAKSENFLVEVSELEGTLSLRETEINILPLLGKALNLLRFPMLEEIVVERMRLSRTRTALKRIPTEVLTQFAEDTKKCPNLKTIDIPGFAEIHTSAQKDAVADEITKDIVKAITNGEEVGYDRVKLFLVGGYKSGKSKLLRNLVKSTWFRSDVPATSLADCETEISLSFQQDLSASWVLNPGNHPTLHRMSSEFSMCVKTLGRNYKNTLRKKKTLRRQVSGSSVFLPVKPLRTKRQSEKVIHGKVYSALQDSFDEVIDETAPDEEKKLPALPRIASKKYSSKSEMFPRSQPDPQIMRVLSSPNKLKQAEFQTSKLLSSLSLIETHDFTNPKLSVWDLSGHPKYLHLQHLFLSNKGIYFLTFNLSVQAKFLEEGEDVGFINLWLNNINMHGPDSLIVLVGTHSKQIDKSELNQVNAQLAEICRHFKNLTFLTPTDSDLVLFAVENSSKKQDDFNSLRRSVEMSMGNVNGDRAKGWSQRIQLSWVHLMNEVFKLKTNITSFSEILKLGHSLGFEKEVIPDIINFYRERGVLLAFQSHDVIFLKPQLLVNALDSLFTISESNACSGIIPESLITPSSTDKSFTKREIKDLIQFFQNLNICSKLDYEKEVKLLFPLIVKKKLFKRNIDPEQYVTFILSFKVQAFEIFQKVVCLLIKESNRFEGCIPPVLSADSAKVSMRNLVLEVFQHNENELTVRFPKEYSVFIGVVADLIKNIMAVLNEDNLELYIEPQLFVQSSVKDEASHKFLRSIWESFECAAADRKENVECINSEVTLPLSSFAILSTKPTTHFRKGEVFDCCLIHEWGCYSPIDGSFDLHQQTLELKRKLEKVGYKVWVDDLPFSGMSFSREKDIIQRSKCVIVILSKRLIRRMNDTNNVCFQELALAAEKGLQTLIPVAFGKKKFNTTWNTSVCGYHLSEDRIVRLQKPTSVGPLKKKIEESRMIVELLSTYTS